MKKINKKTCKGFTLIEMLVVILIIGVLAAVALPQYNKAVEKANATQALSLLRPISNSAQIFYMVNGSYATDFNQLDVNLGQDVQNNLLCYSQSIFDEDCVNAKWGILFMSANNGMRGVLIYHTSGKYRGAGFIIFQGTDGSTNFNKDVIYCYERSSSGGVNDFTMEAGAYCNKIFNGIRIPQYNHNARLFSLE